MSRARRASAAHFALGQQGPQGIGVGFDAGMLGDLGQIGREAGGEHFRVAVGPQAQGGQRVKGWRRVLRRGKSRFRSSITRFSRKLPKETPRRPTWVLEME